MAKWPKRKSKKKKKKWQKAQSARQLNAAENQMIFKLFAFSMASAAAPLHWQLICTCLSSCCWACAKIWARGHAHFSHSHSCCYFGAVNCNGRDKDWRQRCKLSDFVTSEIGKACGGHLCQLNLLSSIENLFIVNQNLHSPNTWK